jgi:glycosyltransferase involved in cell wall biosynthesis
MNGSATPEAERSGRSPLVVIVVPCYNEEHRIDIDAFVDLARSGCVQLQFVNDGSTDGTGTIVRRLMDEDPAIGLMELPRNVGKAEAVRQGLLAAVDSGAAIVGYLDADLATPGPELLRMVKIIRDRSDLAAVFGSRVARLGSRIERSPVRHYTGRVFATVASLALGVAVYDTQCGAKVFRVNPNLVAAIEDPFRSSWSFDVLFCQRLFDGTPELPGLPVSSFLEMPLDAWSDVPGSKLHLADGLHALIEVLGMAVARRRSGDRHRARAESRFSDPPPMTQLPAPAIERRRED